MAETTRPERHGPAALTPGERVILTAVESAFHSKVRLFLAAAREINPDDLGFKARATAVLESLHEELAPFKKLLGYTRPPVRGWEKVGQDAKTQEKVREMFVSGEASQDYRELTSLLSLVVPREILASPGFRPAILAAVGRMRFPTGPRGRPQTVRHFAFKALAMKLDQPHRSWESIADELRPTDYPPNAEPFKRRLSRDVTRLRGLLRRIGATIPEAQDTDRGSCQHSA